MSGWPTFACLAVTKGHVRLVEMFPDPAGLKCSAQAAAWRFFLLAFALFLCVPPASADFSQPLDLLSLTYLHLCVKSQIPSEKR